MKISDYLGKHVSSILEAEPFRQWPVEKSTEDDLEAPISQYVFKGHALALRCDRNDRICVVFLRADHTAKRILTSSSSHSPGLALRFSII